MKFAVKMSHFLPNSVSEKNAKCKNAKNYFCKFQTARRNGWKKMKFEKMQKVFFANFAPFEYSDWNLKFVANCVLRVFRFISAFENGFVFERWQNLDEIWDWLPELVCSLERIWVVELISAQALIRFAIRFWSDIWSPAQTDQKYQSMIGDFWNKKSCLPLKLSC